MAEVGERDLMFHPRQYRAIAEIINRLDMYDHERDFYQEPHSRLMHIQTVVRVISKRHLVVHLGDLFALDNHAFNREEFEAACGEGAEPGEVY